MAKTLTTNEELVAALRAFAPDVMRVTGTPGMSVAIAREGVVVCDEGYGLADLAAGTPATAASIYRVGSFTKLYTAIAALQLVERGVIDLYGRVDDYIDAFELRNPLGERAVTIYDLLTFRSGLADEAIDCAAEWPDSNVAYLTEAFTIDRRREYLSPASRWSAKVGDRFQYSSLGIAVLGHVVATTNPEGLSYPAYVRQRIFDPLGMTSSYFTTSEEDSEIVRRLEPRLTVGYGRFGPALVPTPTLHPLGIPAGGMCSTAGDHLRVLLALLDPEQRADRSVLSSTTVKMMLRAQTDTGAISDGSMYHGLGVQTRPGGVDRYFGHLGAHPWGWYHDSRAYPELELAVVVLTNRFEVSRWDNPIANIAPGIIADLVASLLTSASARDVHSRNSWCYKEGYMAGLLLAERTNGMLGVTSRLTEADVRQLVCGARLVESNAEVDAAWRDGFETAVSDFLDVPVSPKSIRAHLASPGFPVSPAEQALMALHFGRRGGFPVPHRFFSAGHGQLTGD